MFNIYLFYQLVIKGEPMIENENSQTKMKFWLLWTIANAIGLGFAWSLGDYLGRSVVDTLGWKFGQVIGLIVFETVLWVFRVSVIYNMKSYEILRPLDFFVWVTSESFGLLISELPIPNDNLLGITGGAIFATSFGATIWLVFWFIKIPKPQSKTWAINAFLWTFIGLVGGSSLISFFQTTSLIVGEFLAKMYLPIIGMAVGGLIFGLFLGGLTGLALIKIIRWPNLKL